MTDLASLPGGVLVKIAVLEQALIGLTTKLEASRRELQRVRIERRDCVPQPVYDEAGANAESDRVLSEWKRLDAAIEAQVAICGAHERRLRSEERVIRSCKEFLHGLPADARLVAVEGRAGDVDNIRQRIKQLRDEIARTQAMPVLADDLGERVAHYVAALAARARPVIQGIGDGPLRVLYPLHDHADRVTMTGFAPDQANPLLLMAFVDGEHLADRLLQVAVDAGISSTERDQRLHALQAELTQARYDEEVSISAAVERGEEVSRSSSQPPWAVLMIEVEHQAQAAA